jgi:spermidine/putrescine ABC transporter ATP-binding subunit
MSTNYIVEINTVNKKYGTNHVVKDLNLKIKEGEFLTLLGSSGCGKTTTLRMIAGFEEPSDGSILVEGEPIENKEPFERNVNTVFQSYALFPHMTIFDNIAYGLKMKGIKKSEIRERVTEMLELVQLTGFEKRYPKQLSGGQKQRVAIARAVINKPRVLLLDEPLGALDLKLRKQMQLELKSLQKQLGITFVYVTHDQEEALTMSDRIAIMNQGILEQVGTPTEIYENPKTKFVASFIGESTIFEGVVEEKQKNDLNVKIEVGRVAAYGEDFSKDEIINLSIRPEKMKFSPAPMEGFDVIGVVKEHIYVGSVIKTLIQLGNGELVKVQRLAGQELPIIGSHVYIYWDRKDAVCIHTMNQIFYDAIENMDLGGVVNEKG